MRVVHVVVSWMALGLDREPALALTAALPAFERARAARMPSRRRAREFIAARWLLREALTRRLGREAWTCTLEPGTPLPNRPIHWSLAHDGGIAAVAVADGGGVGIDVMRALPPWAAPDAILAVLERSPESVTCGDDPAVRWMRAEASVKLAGGWRDAHERCATVQDAERSVVHTMVRGPADAIAVVATFRPASVVQRRVEGP